MLKKFKIILALASLSISLCLMSNTYSRYVADTTSNVDVLLAKWQILVNDADITSNSNSNVTFTPVIEENANVAAGTVAPSSKGYFDINVNASNVNVSFRYAITLDIVNEAMPDLMITKYAIVPTDYVEGTALATTDIVNNVITNDMLLNGNTSFENFTVRVYFEWFEGTNENMNDVADTAVGTDAAINNTTFTINANIEFEQII